MPVVSLIIPCHDASVYIDSFVESLQSQSLKDWEAIFVDDGSTDDTPVRLKRHQKAEDRIRYIESVINFGGPYYPRKLGIEKSRAPICCLLDIDDRINDQYLEEMYRCFKNLKTDILFPDMRNDGKSITKIDMGKVYKGEDLLKETLFEWRIGCNGGFYDSSLLKKVYNALLPKLCTDSFCDLLDKHGELSRFFSLRETIPFPRYIDEVGTRLLLSESGRVSFCKNARYEYNLNSESISSSNSIRNIEFTLNDYLIYKWVRENYDSCVILGSSSRQQFYNLIDKMKLLNRKKRRVNKKEWREYDRLLKVLFSQIQRNEVKPYLGKPLYLLTSLGYEMTRRLLWLHGRRGWRVNKTTSNNC